jgi:putative ABC transport system permease protein
LSGFTQLLFLVAVVIGVIALLAAMKPVFFKMAVRNISRRKRYSAIVIAGLMIATAMISGSLVVGDTLDYLIRQDVFESTGEVDIVITAMDTAGDRTYFNQSIAYDLAADMEAGGLPHVDGVAPAIWEVVSIINPRVNASAPQAGLLAYDPQLTVNQLLYEDGTEIDPADVTGGRSVINPELADEIDAVVGDTLMVISSSGMPVMLEVSAIAKDTGMARWYNSQTVFLDLTYAQESVFLTPQMINKIDVSAEGTKETGYLVTDLAVEDIEAALPAGLEFDLSTEKKDGIETAETVSDMVSQIFMVMSSFAIIAGVALIINIFVMLAEERKPEMGISRAIGMQRGHLTQSFMFEGTVYAVIASVIGAFAGLIIAWVMVLLFAQMFASTGMSLTFRFDWDSLGVAACGGLLITLLTVIVASWRVSKLNIVRAIRDIPEPVLAKSEKRFFFTGIAGLVFGLLLTFMGDVSEQMALLYSGPCLMVLGGALVGVRYFSPRLPFTLAGLFMIFWTLDPLNWDLIGRIFGSAEGNIEMFIVTGVLLVTGGVLIIMFNSDLMLEGMMRMVRRNRSLLPVFKIAVSYPMNKKFRTALSLFIFALIMFTVIVVMMIASFQRESVTTMTQQYSGGYDIIGYTIRDLDDANLSLGVETLEQRLGTDVVSRADTAVTAPVTLVNGNDTRRTMVIGYPEEMLAEGRFSLAARSDDYDSDQAAWAALSENSSLAIMDGTALQSMFATSYGTFYVDVGDEMTALAQDGGSHQMKVIGIMDQMFVGGMFVSASAADEIAPVLDRTLFYIELAHGLDMTADDASKEIERTFVEYGMITVVVKDLVEEFMSMSSSIMQLMEVFLGIGLIVGITGLGIITIRNIAERRQEIGVMRAIGYQRNMVLSTFMIETSFISLLGILLGLVLGLSLSYQMWEWGGFKESSPFVIPWWEVALIVSIAFGITLLSTTPPSRRAARLAPAEALRRVD